MSTYSKDMQKEMKELVKLIRFHEWFKAVVADGAIPLDDQSILSHEHWVLRIDEISQKYGLYDQ